MGKIIEATIHVLGKKFGGKKRGHVIGSANKLLLCELLDDENNFILCADSKRKVFAVAPGNVKQIGYLDPSKK